MKNPLPPEMNVKGIIIANIICIIMLGGMYAYSVNVSPENVEIGKIGRYMGKYVKVVGIVTKIKNASSGMTMVLEDNNMKNSVMAFANFYRNIFPGTIAEVRGIVQKYSDSYEITIKNFNDLKIIKRSYEINLKILLKNPEYFKNFRLKIHGDITGAKRTYHYVHVTDGFNTTWIYVGRGYKGERKVYFYGEVKNGMLHVENVSLKENKLYKNVSIGEISGYEGKKIEIWGEILNYGGYAYITDGKYSLKAFFQREVKNEEDVYVEGTFIYDEHSGEYMLICK